MLRLRVLLGISALLVAGCAAFFSVTGLGLLFHGASISVMIMASSLEFAKLVSASYLKSQWSQVGRFLKIYLTSAVIILMFLTSMGIFGFLSDAFQQQSIVIEQVDRQINSINTSIKINQDEINRYNTQIVNLTNIRNSQEANISKLIERQEGTSRLSTMIKNADQQIKSFSLKIDSLNIENTNFYKNIDSIKNKNINLEKQVGGFRFVADAFGVDLKSAVKYFIILIVFVFDPLAIALVLAFNSTNQKKETMIIEEGVLEEENKKKRGRPKMDKTQMVWKSEFGEEKHIERLLENVPKDNFLVEIGAGDGYTNSHTRYFIENGYNALLIDKDNRGNDEIKQHYLMKENILPILKTYQCPKVFDFLSIDIRGIDYWILEQILKEYSPKLIISRFNASFPQDSKWNSITIQNENEFSWAGDDYFGYTMEAGRKLGEQHGYTIVFQNDDNYVYYLKNEFVNEKPIVNYTHNDTLRKSHKTSWVEI